MDPRPCRDRLSALPDDILVAILEKLGSTREATRVCVLSRRWAKLPRLLPEAEIGIWEFLPGIQGQRSDEVRPAQLSRAMESFCQAVSAFTSAETKPRCLKLKFFLVEEGYKSFIRRVLGSHNKVGALQLAILTRMHEVDCDLYLMRRYARRFDGFLAGGGGLFRQVTSLELSNLWIGSDDVAAVLRACPRLGRLVLTHCYRLKEELVVDAPALRELTLYMCFYTRLVLRSAPNLTRLECDMWLWLPGPGPLSLPGVRRLVNAASPWTNSEIRLSELLAHKTSLRCLSLNFEGEDIWVPPEPPMRLRAAFAKLTVLSVGGIYVHYDLVWMMFLLEAAPFLRQFSIAVQKHFCVGEDHNKQRNYTPLVSWKETDFRHSHLENLQVSGFEVQDKFLAFVRLVMERATNLKAVVLADVEPCEHCDFENGPHNDDEKCSIAKQLRDQLSSSVQILIQ